MARVALFALVCQGAVALCPLFDQPGTPGTKCDGIADHRLCISAAINTVDDGAGGMRKKFSPLDGGEEAPEDADEYPIFKAAGPAGMPAEVTKISLACQQRAAMIRVHVLYHGKNRSLGDGGDCERARVAFMNETCSHFSTCAAESCIIAGFGPVGDYATHTVDTPVPTENHKDELGISKPELAKMLMPRSDLHKFARVLGLDDADTFFNNRDPKLADDMEIAPGSVIDGVFVPPEEPEEGAAAAGGGGGAGAGAAAVSAKLAALSSAAFKRSKAQANLIQNKASVEGDIEAEFIKEAIRHDERMAAMAKH